MDERWHLIALHQIKGVGWHTITQLLASGWIPGEPITSSMYAHLRASKVPKGVLERIMSRFRLPFIKQVKQVCEERKIGVITRLDDTYPSLLKEIAQPPWILYLRGNQELLQNASLAVVGTRKPTAYGMNITKGFVAQLVQNGLTIVSGMAYGIDAIAHEQSLHKGGKTIAVLASGVDVIYPKRHRSLYERCIQADGLIVSESAPGTQPHPGLFPQRNRVISGLSLGTLVVEAATKSGSLITANYSLEQGREVFAVPGPIHSPLSAGTLQLIQEGAKCVRTVENILEELPPHVVGMNKETHIDLKKEKAEVIEGLNEVESIVFSLIQHEPIQISHLLEQSVDQLAASQIYQALLSLEMKQLVNQLPGQHYIRCHSV